MDDLPEALLAEIIKRVIKTSDLKSLSLVSKRLYSAEAKVRDAIQVGCGLYPVTLSLASLCSRLPNLCKVEFNYSSWTPIQMQLDNEGLRVLSYSCPLLTDLTLSFCSNIDDSGLGFLACLKKLTSLRLNTLSEITSSGLLSVAVGCKSLSAFHLIGCKKLSGGDWLEYLGSVGSLEQLIVKYCKRIGQFDILAFGPGWMKLKKFEFQIVDLPSVFNPYDPSYVTDKQYRYDFCCESLKDLTLARITAYPEIGLRCVLSKCKSLENLCLYLVFGLNDNDMVTLANKCSNLRSISLILTPEFCEGYVYKIALTDGSLKALALRCPVLQSFELKFWGCQPDWPQIGFTQEGLMTLIQSCPIHHLMLSGANIFDDEGMKALSDMQSLESLELERCIAITDTGMHLLARSPCLMNLTLRLCDGVTDDGVNEVVRVLRLESLIIEKCAQVSQEAVQGAAKSVHYRFDCPGYMEWVDRCVHVVECDHLAG